MKRVNPAKNKMNNFAKYLEISLGYFSSVIINETNKKVLLTLASFLPEMFAKSLFIFEKKQLDYSGEFDLSVFASTDNKVFNNLNSIFSFTEIAEFTTKSIEWERIENLCGNLSDEKPEFKEKLLNNPKKVENRFLKPNLMKNLKHQYMKIFLRNLISFCLIPQKNFLPLNLMRFQPDFAGII